MPHTDLSSETQRCIERFDARFQVARMRAAQALWPELEIELRTFGRANAVRMRPGFFRKNVVVGFGREETTHLASSSPFRTGRWTTASSIR